MIDLPVRWGIGDIKKMEDDFEMAGEGGGG